jgi:DNA-binding MarR family transcriptional regulator
MSPTKKIFAPEATAKPIKQPPQTTSLDASLGYSLRRAQLSTYRDFGLFMDKFSIRPSQFAALVLIRSNPGLTQAAVSIALGIQKANFVAVLDRLEERRLTERRKVGGDRRSSALYLTREGEVFVKKMEAGHAALEAKLTSRLGERRSEQLLALLHEFSAAKRVALL